MNILRSIARWLLISLTTICVMAWITIMTMQATLLNRQVVFGWLDKSGAYNHIIDSVLNLQNVSQGTQSLDQESLKRAVQSTLTPAFIKQVTETALNSVYDWLEGKSDSISFSVDVADKRTELQQQLQTILAPQLKDLPTCSGGFSGLSSSDAKCLPQGGNADQVAQNTAKQAIEGSDFLTEPITQDWIDPSGLQNIKWLPITVQSIGTLSIALPIVALLSGAGYVLLSSKKLAGGRTLAGHLLFGTGLTATAGVLIWVFGSSMKIDPAGADPNQVVLIRDVIQPIVYQIAPAIGFTLTLFAGSVAILCTVVWITLFILGRKKGQSLPDSQTASHELPKIEEPPRHAAPITTHVLPRPSPEHNTVPVDTKPPSRPVGRM